MKCFMKANVLEDYNLHGDCAPHDILSKHNFLMPTQIHQAHEQFFSAVVNNVQFGQTFYITLSKSKKFKNIMERKKPLEVAHVAPSGGLVIG